MQARQGCWAGSQRGTAPAAACCCFLHASGCTKACSSCSDDEPAWPALQLTSALPPGLPAAPCLPPVCSGHSVIDHFNYDSHFGAEDHAAVLADGFVQSAAVLPQLHAPVLFRGIGLSVAADSETVRAGGGPRRGLLASLGSGAASSPVTGHTQAPAFRGAGF